MTLLDFERRAEDVRPCNLEAEQALLGIVLHHNAAFHDAEGVTPEHFLEPLHSRLWAAMGENIAKDLLAEPIGLMERFKADVAFVELGGLRYLADLVDRAPAFRMASHFAGLILDAAQRRGLVDVARELGCRATNGNEIPADLIAEAESALAELARGVEPSAWSSAITITRQALQMAHEQSGQVGLSTGLSELDDATGGLRSGQLIIVAGRPAMGKSTAALQIAKAVASARKGVMFFSMEMPDFDLGLRLACDLAHYPLAPIYQGSSSNPTYYDAARNKLSPAQWAALNQGLGEIAEWPLDIDVRPGLTVRTMQNAARRRLREWERAGIERGCIMVDHLTIARADQDRRGNKVAEVGDISRGLAEMAKTLDVPVVALCQLSRDVEKRDKDRRPTLADLRWSGEIEQDARLVMFLYRPEYYLRPPEDPTDFESAIEHRTNLEKVRHKLFWLIEKNNNGPTGQVETYCNIACSAIRDRLGSVSQ